MIDSSKQSHIQLLPEHIIDQIKAGEVIEKVSTLVKELIENSIDAGATQIDLTFINNGLDFIQVTDNGKGIAYQDLPLAFARHATSKISKFEDLYKLYSYGFRGEALASIASISKLTCESTHQGIQSSYMIEGGVEIIHEKKSETTKQSGTTLYIKDLFYNTPARLKFLKSKTSEKNAIVKILKSFILSNPELSFSIKWDDEDKVFYKKIDEKLKRIQNLIPNGEFIRHQTNYDENLFEIIINLNATRGHAHKQQFIFVNNRYIQDIALHKIILNSAKKLWPEAMSGDYFAFLDIPSDQLDINVHPNKTQVKFFKNAEVYGLVSGTIKDLSLSKKVKPSEVQKDLLHEVSPTKSIQYKSFDFHSTENTNEYIQSIHQDKGFNLQSPLRNLLTIKDLSLFQKEESFYLASTDRILHTLFEKYIQTSHEQEQTPLLISHPIKIKSKVNTQNLNFLIAHQFEIDSLDPSTYVLRSFPKSFEDMPYIDILKNLLNSTKKDISSSLFKNIEFIQPEISFIEKLFEAYTVSELLDSKTIKKVEYDTLKKIYEL